MTRTIDYLGHSIVNYRDHSQWQGLLTLPLRRPKVSSPDPGGRPVLDSFKGYFFGFSWGCWRPISAARSVTIWILSNWSGLLQLKRTSLSGIAFLSGPICDRANRVTQACRLKRIASQHDRQSGHIGDFTDHLCPCPSILRWALPCGREGLFCKRWQDRSVASDDRDPIADNPPYYNNTTI